ncbi:MAG: hypothetical protein QOK16_553 [Solirubrobacteraceae bacterium]|nr:hypothetical protein [Solirubrobacteraceae bacterium]
MHRELVAMRRPQGDDARDEVRATLRDDAGEQATAAVAHERDALTGALGDLRDPLEQPADGDLRAGNVAGYVGSVDSVAGVL